MMLIAFQKFSSINPHATKQKQKKVFKLLSTRSAVGKSEVLQNMDFSILIKNEVIEILSHYKLSPKTITIIKK